MEDFRKFVDNEDIVFLESEIIEDDADAPFGVIVDIPETQKKAIGSDNKIKSEAEENKKDETRDAEEPTVEKSFEEAFFENAPLNVARDRDADREPIEDNKAADDNKLTEDIEETAEISRENDAIETAPEQDDNAEAVTEPAHILENEAAADSTSASAKQPVDTTEQNNAASAPEIWKVAEIGGKKKTAGAPKKTKEVSEMKATETKSAAKKTETAKDTVKKETSKKPTAKTSDTAKKDTAKKPASKAAAKPAEKEIKKTKSAAELETVLIAGDDSAPHGKFVIKKTDKGNFVYKLYSFNHRVVAIGAEQYSSLATCKTGINSVMKNVENAPIEDQTLKKWEEQKCPKWQIYADKKGEIRLRLIASNGNIVATTNDGYLSKDAAKNGIEAIGRACKGADVVRNDTLW